MVAMTYFLLLDQVPDNKRNKVGHHGGEFYPPVRLYGGQGLSLFFSFFWLAGGVSKDKPALTANKKKVKEEETLYPPYEPNGGYLLPMESKSIPESLPILSWNSSTMIVVACRRRSSRNDKIGEDSMGRRVHP